LRDVAVIIPCFNAGSFLLESVASALAQVGGVGPAEVIIVDDRSTDDSTVQALGTLASHPRVRILQNEGPQGSAASRNTGVRHARAEWLAFLDADDWWPADSIQKRLSALEQFPDAEWIGGDFIEKNEDGTFQESGRFERNLASYHFLACAYKSRTAVRLAKPLHYFLAQTPTHTIVTLIRKPLLERVGGFAEDLLRAQDYQLFLRLAAVADYTFVPEVVAFYRLHDHNSTRSITHTQQWRVKAIESLMTRSEFAAVRSNLRHQIARLHYSNCTEFRREGDFRLAMKAAWSCVLMEPSSRSGWRSLAASALGRK
jgi:glycosyltransferase involved in cell wall biosynthesis